MPSNFISKHGKFWISFEFKFQFIYSHLVNYNTTKKKKKEVKTELTIHWIKHNKGKKVCSSQRSQAFELVTTTDWLQVGGDYTVLIKN